MVPARLHGARRTAFNGRTTETTRFTSNVSKRVEESPRENELPDWNAAAPFQGDKLFGQGRAALNGESQRGSC